MFRKLFVVALVAFVPSFAFAQANRDAVAKQLEANERAINVAVQKGDAAAFTALVAADGFAMDGTGLLPVSEFVKMFPQIKLQTFAIDNVKVVMAGDNAAVITYKFTGKGSMMGQPMPSPVWASTTYANRGGKWVAMFHQETLVTPAPAPAKK